MITPIVLVMITIKGFYSYDLHFALLGIMLISLGFFSLLMWWIRSDEQDYNEWDMDVIQKGID